MRAQIPKIFAKLLYGSKFHRLRMSRGQQGIGISAAGMYGQLTTGTATSILSKTKHSPKAHRIEVQIDTRAEQAGDPLGRGDGLAAGIPGRKPRAASRWPIPHGTQVAIEMTRAYVRGRLSVDEYLKQCAVVNPHLQLHFRVSLLKKEKGAETVLEEGAWQTYERATEAAAAADGGDQAASARRGTGHADADAEGQHRAHAEGALEAGLLARELARVAGDLRAGRAEPEGESRRAWRIRRARPCSRRFRRPS